jgi:hypothetical protein
MTDVADLYGLTVRDIERVGRTLSRVLELSFQPHESTFWGDYYLAHSSDWKEQLRLLDNFNQLTGAWNKPEFQKYPLILEVSVTSLARAHEIEKKLLRASEAGAVLLRRKEYPGK